jgi:hypothetical protein
VARTTRAGSEDHSQGFRSELTGEFQSPRRELNRRAKEMNPDNFCFGKPRGFEI